MCFGNNKDVLADEYQREPDVAGGAGQAFVNEPALRHQLPEIADEMVGAPPVPVLCPYRQLHYRVRVSLFQDQQHAVGGVQVNIGGVVFQTDAHGLTPELEGPAGEYLASVGAMPYAWARCNCAACNMLGVCYVPWPVQEYGVVQIAHDLQIIELHVDQLLGVRLGYPEQVTGPTTIDRSWLAFYLPEIKGAGPNNGTGFVTSLGLTINRGAIRFPGQDGVAVLPEQEQILPPQADGGWRLARIVGAQVGPATLEVRLSETAYAREATAFDAVPLIPWQFWMYPTDHENNATSQAPVAGSYKFSPLWAWDVLSGRDPRAPKSAFGWEKNPENGHCDTFGAWSGHCNQAAAASIIFVEPPPDALWQRRDVARGNLDLQLDGEALKLLATEFAGNRVRTQTLFTTHAGQMLEHHALVDARAKALRANNQRYYRAADDVLYREDETLVAGPQRENIELQASVARSSQLGEFNAFEHTTWEAYNAALQAWTVAAAACYVDHVENMNVNHAAPAVPERGRYAVKLFQALQSKLGTEGVPLLTDVRTTAVRRCESEVWNQAVYLYRATYRQHPLAALDVQVGEPVSAQDLEVTVKIYWNEDKLPTYGTATATVTPAQGGVQVAPRELGARGNSLFRTMRLRLQFTDGGRLAPASDLHNIESCVGTMTKLEGNPQVAVITDYSCFPPRYFQEIVSIRPEPNMDAPEGNPYVDNHLLYAREGLPALITRARFPYA